MLEGWLADRAFQERMGEHHLSHQNTLPVRHQAGHSLPTLQKEGREAHALGIKFSYFQPFDTKPTPLYEDEVEDPDLSQFEREVAEDD
jgi:hypothetical protein